MSWNNIIGQDRAKRVLQTYIDKNRIPHALLFYGPEGVGKDATAIHIAKILNCKYKTVDSCNKCLDCIKISKLQHPNLHLVFALPVGKGEQESDSPLEKLTSEEIEDVRSQIEEKSRNLYHRIVIEKANFIKISSIRELRRKTALNIPEGSKRVVVIMNAEEMGIAASNALLKTLEEPPLNTILILTTSNKEALLQTIISRCQLIRFESLSENHIVNGLVQFENIDQQKSEIIARLANGSYLRAIQLIKSNFLERRNQIIDFLVLILKSNNLKISQEVENIVKLYTKAEIEQFFLLLNVWFRDVITLQEGGGKIIYSDLSERLNKFLSKFSKADFSAIIVEIERALSLIKKNAYIPLVFLQFIINIRNKLLAIHE